MRKKLGVTIFLAVTALGCLAPAYAQRSTTETIVLIRHGEKTAPELGQLNMRGLNRSLLLPDILIGKFGKPDYLFAPNPSVQVGWGAGRYSYIRPLATIEPTAIRLGMPVNAQIGYNDINGLETELMKPMYAGSMIFVAWEHLAEDQFAKNVMATYGNGSSTVPDWPGGDFDSIFIIRLHHTGAATTATFVLDHEGLNGRVSAIDPTAGRIKG